MIFCSGFLTETQSAENLFPLWRLSPALDLPVWLKLGGHQRSRYESLNGQFRAFRKGSDQYFVFRTALMTEITIDGLEFGAEILDSRQSGAANDSTINNSIVNAVELVQGYGAINFDNFLIEDSKSRILIGRHTMDVGSRRLIARNRFRNTTNNFTGINGLLTTSSGKTIRVFYVLPVNRLPWYPESLLHNDIEFDKESFEVQFWGVHAHSPEIFNNITGEFDFFGLFEEDSSDLPTLNRHLYTTGIRLFREPAQNRFDFEVESVLQIGESRFTILSADTNDLDHLAHFQHLEIGYTFNSIYSPRLSVQCDYASGDEDPNDDSNNRFDTLYGARRFDFGPTGIYGPFARSNIFSPGYRFSMNLWYDKLDLRMAHRFYWLASKKDFWYTGGLRDTTGNSGRYIGNQVEIQIQWKVFPGNLIIEIGGAYLFAGEFMENAPNSNGEGDATYGYMQTEFIF